MVYKLKIFEILSVPCSQVIDSIGYPATGHLIINLLPEMAVIFGIDLINGRPAKL